MSERKTRPKCGKYPNYINSAKIEEHYLKLGRELKRVSQAHQIGFIDLWNVFKALEHIFVTGVNHL